MCCGITASVMFLGRMWCTPRRNFVSNTLCIYIDDLIKELRLADFGVCVGAHYTGSMLYADDIALLAGSCYG